MISVVIISTTVEQTIQLLKNIEIVRTKDIEEIIVVKWYGCHIDYKVKDMNIKYIDTTNIMAFSNLCNAGIKKAIKENDVFILTDKVRIVNNTFENLKIALYSNEDIGIATPIINIGPDYQSLSMVFESFDDYGLYCKDKINYETHLNEVTLRTSFSAVLVKRGVLDKIDGFDEIVNTTEFTSADFCLRALRSKYKNLLCRHSFVYLEEEYIQYDDSYYLNLDKNKFKGKWNFDPNYCFAMREDVVNLIKIDKLKQTKVLEIGCACGATLLKIKQTYPKADLYGIELEQSTSEIAKYTSKNVKNIDIESDEVIFEDGFFDVILALDVLEHLRDPWKAMQKIKQALKPNGQIIISIPNVMNISVVNNMIKGRWDYEDSGILDRFHLRFFTFNSIFELFESIGEYSLYYLTVECITTEEEEQLINMLSSIDNVKPAELRVYQYIVTNK